MAGQFEGRVAVVTGAGRNIGRADALLFARQGAKVVVNDLPGEAGEPDVADQVAEEIRALGGEAAAHTASIASMAGAKALIEAAMDRFGRIDFLINNAGVTRWNRVDQMSEEEFDEVVNVSFKGYFATIRYASPHMMKTGGAIVNMSSPSGFGHYGMANYGGAKEAAAGLTRCVARDLAEFKVRCYAVRPMSLPSRTGSPGVMHSLKYTEEKLGVPRVSHRHLDMGGMPPGPEQVAAACVWLCTPRAEPLNGREIYIAGGHIALIQEPELIRSRFNPGGWTLEALCTETITRALTAGIENPLAKAGES